MKKLEEHNTPETLSAYIDGELPIEEAVLVAEHMKECTLCRRQIEELKAACQLLTPIGSDVDIISDDRLGVEVKTDPAERQLRIKHHVKRRLRERLLWSLIAVFIIAIPLAAVVGSIPVVTASFEPSLPQWFRLMRGLALILLAVPLIMWAIELLRDIHGIVIYTWLTSERDEKR